MDVSVKVFLLQDQLYIFTMYLKLLKKILKLFSST